MNKKLFIVIIISLIWVYKCFNNRVDESAVKIEKLLDVAQSFEGVNYRAGGTTKRGMDCSGLVSTSFKSIDVKLPRSSASMSTVGTKVSLKKIQKGDLLFFNIDRLKGKINHVGLVTSTDNEIIFIHSTTSKGVIYSSMKENYWKNSFVIAKRIITH
ncbi:C40 family peptidase [Tenacibaculum sp. MEBiC06402]|uniref:C40 family peptidase n=1 Tax=unclassified Tenacibaculum TaxID=2635139 RepID=UPI003B9A958F